MSFAENVLAKVKGTPAFKPATIDSFGDWAIEAGDVISVEIDGRTENVPVFSSDTDWNGAAKTSLSCTGNPKREVQDKQTRKDFATASGFAGGMVDMETNYVELVAYTDNVKAGLYAIASEDDIKGLKEGKTTLFAQIQDDKELLWAGVNARVKSEDFGKYQQAVVDTYATIDDVNSGFSAIATKDEREKWKEAKTTMFAQIGKDTERLQAGINARVTSAEFGTYKDANTKVFAQIQDDLSGCVKEAYLELYAVSDGKGHSTTFVDLVADTIALKGRVDLTDTLSVSNGIITSTGQIISQKNIRANTGLSSTKLELDTNDFKMAGKQYYPTEITSTTGAVMALGYT